MSLHDLVTRTKGWKMSGSGITRVETVARDPRCILECVAHMRHGSQPVSKQRTPDGAVYACLCCGFRLTRTSQRGKEGVPARIVVPGAVPTGATRYSCLACGYDIVSAEEFIAAP
jgi:hypothetical protein